MSDKKVYLLVIGCPHQESYTLRCSETGQSNPSPWPLKEDFLIEEEGRASQTQITLENLLAEEVFKALNTERIHQKLQDQLKIAWHLAPLRIPSHSGVIEGLVKTIKNPLTKFFMNQLLTETEFYAVLIEVKASVNMKPLSCTSENPDDKNLLPLTPSHMLRIY